MENPSRPQRFGAVCEWTDVKEMEASPTAMFLMKPRRYSRRAAEKKDQHHKTGKLHNLHTERTELQNQPSLAKMVEETYFALR